MNSKSFQLKIAAEAKLISAVKPTQRRMEISVIAPSVQSSQQRTPLNLSLVIDRSGSMSGGKLEQAKTAADYILSQLKEEDLISLVAFDDQIWTMSAAVHPNPNNRIELKRALRRLESGGSTNLGDGWLRGCQLIGEVQQPNVLNRCLLLTDGEANQGMVNLEELGYHANQINQRGVSTSTFGIGQHFNERLLEHMANQGGGHYYYIENDRDIPVIMAKELEGLSAISSRRTSLVITFPESVDLSYLGDLKQTRQSNRLEIQLGDLVADREELIHLMVITPPQAEQDSLSIEAMIAGIGEDDQKLVQTESFQFKYANEVDLSKESADKDLIHRYTKVEAGIETEKALQLEKAGRRSEGSHNLREYLRQAAPSMGWDDSKDLNHIAELIDRGLSPMEQKMMHQSMYNNRRGRRELTDEEKEIIRKKIEGMKKPTS